MALHQEDAFVGLRQTLVEMVHDSLQHKPEGVADEEYFRELEPLLNHLASDCLRSQADPNSFVREWVKTKDNQEAMARVSPFGLLAMQTWQKARETDEKQQNVHGLKGVSALQHLGKVLRALRHEGITSASAAFLYFNPEEDGGPLFMWQYLTSKRKLSKDRRVSSNPKVQRFASTEKTTTRRLILVRPHDQS
ncbi:unnamed protein product [Durusdinium trenchii]|uniref:Uncharacterized protein n=1 Tax=Durusdinium trenchii TaxID=1381693 RepID=A0ABP0NSD3_9DINO